MERHGEGFETSPAPNRNASCGDSIMALKALPSPEVLRQLLRYEPDTGKLFWLPRGPEWFAPDGFWSQTTASRRFNANYANQEAFTALSHGYRCGRIFDRMHKAHRVIFAMMTGAWPTSEVDHRDLDRSNNRWGNLRPATGLENRINKAVRRDSKLGIKGVQERPGGRFVARITLSGNCTHLGRFGCPTAAHIAYVRASAKMHGAFGRAS